MDEFRQQHNRFSPQLAERHSLLANFTIPFWSYNMIRDSLAFLPIATTLDHPSTFLQLLNSASGWVAGDATAPQTPSAFISQGYGFWPMGENLTLYVNMQGGGINISSGLRS
jgi:hypothetical protein